jgi:hypothetical protein
MRLVAGAGAVGSLISVAVRVGRGEAWSSGLGVVSRGMDQPDDAPVLTPERRRH